MMYCAMFAAHASQGLQYFQEKRTLKVLTINHNVLVNTQVYCRLLGGWGRGLTVLRLRWTSPIPI